MSGGDAGAVLSVDLGGTTMRVGVVAPDGTLLQHEAEPTPHQDDCPESLERLMASVRDCGARFAAVVVGVPGRVNYREGRLEHAPNLPRTWLPELTENRLGRFFDVPLHLANDADLAAVGESWFGAGVGYGDVVYLTVSTGLGAGVILGGRLLRGARSLAEIGHTVLSLEALAAAGPATAEDLGSGTALAANARAVGVEADGAELVALVRAGDAGARAIWETTMLPVAATVVNLAHLFSPDAIVIGGGLGRNGALVLDPARDLLARHGPQGLPVPIAVAEASLGDDAGLIGGAAWVRATG